MTWKKKIWLVVEGWEGETLFLTAATANSFYNNL